MRANAPVRVCDIGGWTDTWFARHGHVFSIAVRPGVEVVAAAFARAPRPHAVVIDAVDYGERVVVGREGARPERHRLLAAAVHDVIHENAAGDERAIEVSVTSGVPPGCGTGTSAAVAVALIGALDRLTSSTRPARTRAEIARAAHRVEVDRLGLQSGVQDQLAAAHGGVNHVEITDYPNARVHRLAFSAAARTELEHRLVLVYLGRAHHSSAVHERVIAELADEGPDAPRLAALRRTAIEAVEAFVRGDLSALGRTMIDSTDGQAALHPSLVGDDAWRVIDAVRARGALGWKVNGAGGDGGSLTLLCASARGARGAVIDAVEAIDGASVLPVRLSGHGLRRHRIDRRERARRDR